MFNIGGGELIVILLVALIVLGPQRLPDAARQLGKAMGDLRRLSSGFQNEMKQALDTADDPTRVAARRNVLATEVVPAVDDAAPAADEDEPSERGAAAAPVIDDTGTVAEPEAEPTPATAAADSIAAVSAQPSAPSTKPVPTVVPEDPPRRTNA